MMSLKSKEKVSHGFDGSLAVSRILCTVKLERARKERLKLIESDNMLAKKQHIIPDSTPITLSTGGADAYSLKV